MNAWQRGGFTPSTTLIPQPALTSPATPCHGANEAGRKEKEINQVFREERHGNSSLYQV